jgi:bifunctional DNA-binding transcriptional regulator/antitoxin component of YhaV-PrlF toxin-antitoxin module
MSSPRGMNSIIIPPSEMSPTHEVVVDERGEVVLPPEVLAELGLKPGMPMLLSIEADGSLLLRPYPAVAGSNRGILE